MAFQELEDLIGQKTLTVDDTGMAKVNFQWSSNANISSSPSLHKVWFLRGAIGSNLTLIIKGVTIFTGLSEVDFHDNGFRIGHDDWSLSGVDFAYGYSVRFEGG